MFGKMSVKSVYRKHYPRILAIAKRLSIAEDPEFEILPAMMFLSLRVLVDNGKDKQLGSCVTQEIAVRCPEIKGPVLKRRMRLYSDIINNNKPLVCQWFYDDPSFFDANDILKCSALLSDILYNKELAEDYENAPLVIRGYDVAIDFMEKVAKPLFDELAAFCLDLDKV